MEEKFSNLQPQESLIPKELPKRRIFILILVGALISLGGVTGILAARIWDPLWNPFRPKPEKVIEGMILEMEKVKTWQDKIEFVLTGSNEGKFNLSLNAQRKNDKTQPKEEKFESSFNVTVSLLSGKEDPVGMKFALAGEVRGIGETLYLKFTTFPLIPFLEISGIDFSQIREQWIKIDQESITKLEEEIMGEERTPEMEKKYREEIERQKVIEEQFREKIEKVLKERKFFIAKKELPDEKIDGMKVYHYLVSLDKNEILKAISEILKIMEETMLGEYGVSSTFEKENFEKELREFFEEIGEIEGELWIGKKDYLLYRVKFEKTFDLSQLEGKGIVSIKLNLENSKFNQPVKIEAPSEYKDLAEILVSSFRELDKIRFGDKDAGIMINMLQVRMIAEMIYADEASYRNFCRYNTLNENHINYGAELARIEKEIREMQGKILNLSCRSSATSYCVVVDLVSPDKGKYCIDSSGRAGEIGENLTCLGDGTSKNPYRCPERKSPFEGIKLPTKEDLSLFQAAILESFLRLFKR